jgi:hypothetical protein
MTVLLLTRLRGSRDGAERRGYPSVLLASNLRNKSARYLVVSRATLYRYLSSARSPQPGPSHRLGTTMGLCDLPRASHGDYEDSFLPTGFMGGSPEDAFDTACGLYLADPTAQT